MRRRYEYEWQRPSPEAEATMRELTAVPCSHCGRRFRSLAGLKTHLRSARRTTKPSPE